MSDFDDDLDHLASELNLVAPQRTAEAPGTHRSIESWLRRLRELQGSDLLLVTGAPPLVRTQGRLVPTSELVLGNDDITAAIAPLVPSRLHDAYQRGAAIDLAFTVRGLGRFRMNYHRERGRAAAAIRALPLRIPKLADLHFTHEIGLLSTLPRGLVLIGGPTGSGKTTTLAALVAEINARDARHIVTVEDPIEYDHAHQRSVVEQIEIGVDAPDFPTALRSALRQAPDVIVVGEMRDPETMRIALAAAETGHLVFATVHATDVSAAVARIADGFPAERQNAVRQELAMALSAVLTQTLIATAAGAMVPAAELLVVSYGARQHIRKNALQHLHQEITITRKAGSFTFEESLGKLVETGAIDRNEARLRAPHPDEFDSIKA
ncbi:MAG TPA: PilT/PilU family type 4a pilus ATPase [Vicinamibacterales bacterium]|nr:PilT/PilU family type 4a pilus ATPase [Vicinamibacterales bacterium]